MPKRATPTTRMTMPSLLSQFVPRVSSIAETVFMRCWRVGRGAGTRYGETGGGPETRAAGGRGEVADGGVVGRGGATGADGFTSTGVFAAAGKTGFGSTGAGDTGSFCAGVPAGTVETGAGAMGAGSCGFSCGSGFFSGTGNDIGTGSLTGAGRSARGVGTGIPFTADAAGVAGRCAGSPATGAAGCAVAVSWRLRSATSR